MAYNNNYKQHHESNSLLSFVEIDFGLPERSPSFSEPLSTSKYLFTDEKRIIDSIHKNDSAKNAPFTSAIAKNNANNLMLHIEGMGVCVLKEMPLSATFWDLYIQLASNYSNLKNRKINFSVGNRFLSNWEVSLDMAGIKEWDVIKIGY
ncbi:hypothetical protein MHBO_003744 [Bonamia ostreae]|uniref:Ubiquitin-like domain-containing protein n=1 Tax=Bonamia ostreae TaxID=126728 RepID=A0ABV2ARD2_9EUKA